MNDICEMMWGKNDRRTLLVQKLLRMRANPKPLDPVIKKQKVGDQWIETEVPQDNSADEFTTFCKTYQEEGTKWAEWVKESPALQGEVRILWGQLLIVANMSGSDFAVPARMLRQWQKAIGERIVCHGQVI